MKAPLSEREIPLRHAIAAALSLLIAFQGLVHEVVGTRLYPEGPAAFGGLVPWHLVGLAGIVVGVAMFASTLGLIRFPVRASAAIVAALGLFITVADLVTGEGFHLFAATLAFCGAALLPLYRSDTT